MLISNYSSISREHLFGKAYSTLNDTTFSQVAKIKAQLCSSAENSEISFASFLPTVDESMISSEPSWLGVRDPSIDELIEDSVPIDADTAQQIADNFTRISNAGSCSMTSNGVTCNIYKISDADIEFSSAAVADNWAKVLFKVGDQYYLRKHIPTNAIENALDPWPEGTMCECFEKVAREQHTFFMTFMQCLGSISAISGDSMSALLSSFVTNVCHLTPSSTIMGNIRIISEFYGDVSYETLAKKSLSILDYILGERINSQLNEILIAACDVVLSKVTNIAAWFAGMTNRFNDLIQAGRDLISAIVDAFVKYGYPGIVHIIVNFIKGNAGLALDDDGQLTFTDNSKFVTTQYVTGMLTEVVNSITSLAAILLSKISFIAAVAVSIIGRAFTSIYDAIHYDYDNLTYCKVVNDAVLQIFPYGGIQGTGNQSSFPKWFVTMLQESGLIAVRFPGGYVIFTMNQETGVVAFEFHPGLNSHDIMRYSDNRYVYLRSHIWLEQDLDVSTNYTAHIPSLTSLISEENSAEFHDPSYWDNMDEASRDELIRQYLASANTRFTCFLLSAIWSYGRSHDETHDIKFNFGSSTYPWVAPWTTFGAWFDEVGKVSPYFASPSWLSLTNEPINMFGLYPGISGLTAVDVKDAFFHPSDWFTDGEFSGAIYPNVRDFSTLFGWLLYSGYYCEVIELGVLDSYFIQTPKYDRATFITNVVAASIATAAVAAVSTVAVLKTKKFIQKKSFQFSNKAETAWYNYADDPSEENYNAYRKAVRNNNLFAMISGGTKLSQRGLYYDGESSSSSFISEYLDGESQDSAEDNTISVLKEQTNSATGDLYQVITGHSRD